MPLVKSWFPAVRVSSVSAVAVSVSGAPVLAHHAMDGVTPRTIWEGFASGIAHPVIGPDHFAFVVLAALLFSMTRPALPLAMTLVVSGLAGTLLRSLPAAVPFAETMVALTLVCAGVLVLYRFWSGARRDTKRTAGFVALAGTVHGLAWGESVVGADAGVLGSYLAGLAVVQFAVLAVLISLFRTLADKMPRAYRSTVAAAGVGGVLLGAGFLALA